VSYWVKVFQEIGYVYQGGGPNPRSDPGSPIAHRNRKHCTARQRELRYLFVCVLQGGQMLLELSGELGLCVGGE
jgi:hypothetical protein